MAKKEVEKEFVRRGFDIRLDLYNSMRVQAAKEGVYPKEFLCRAIKNELKKCRKKKA